MFVELLSSVTRANCLLLCMVVLAVLIVKRHRRVLEELYFLAWRRVVAISFDCDVNIAVIQTWHTYVLFFVFTGFRVA